MSPEPTPLQNIPHHPSQPPTNQPHSRSLWSRFFCLSVYITMYLNDHQRSKFYEVGAGRWVGARWVLARWRIMWAWGLAHNVGGGRGERVPWAAPPPRPQAFLVPSSGTMVAPSSAVNQPSLPHFSPLLPQALGLNTTQFNRHVILETNNATARIFPEVRPLPLALLPSRRSRPAAAAALAPPS